MVKNLKREWSSGKLQSISFSQFCSWHRGSAQDVWKPKTILSLLKEHARL